MTKKLLRHEAQTPTLGLTIVGLTALAAHVTHKVEHADTVAFIALGLAGGGVAMALGAEVERHGEEWGFCGIIRSMKRPSKQFWIQILSHLPQLLAAAAIALKWRRGSSCKP